MDIIKAVAMKEFALTEEKFASTFTKKDEEGNVTLNEDASDIYLKMVSEKKEAFKKKIETSAFDDAFAKATKKTNNKLEARLRAIAPDLDENLMGEDLIKAFSKRNVSSEVDIKKDPDYLDLERRFNSLSEDLTTKFESDLKIKESEYDQKYIGDIVKNYAIQSIMSASPVGDNKAVMDTKFSDFGNKFAQYDYVGDGKTGDKILTHKYDSGSHKKGDRVEDDYGNPITVNDHIETWKPNYFEFAKHSGNKAPDGNTGEGSVSKVTEEQYNKALIDINSVDLDIVERAQETILKYKK